MHREIIHAQDGWPTCACGCDRPVPRYVAAHAPAEVQAATRFWADVQVGGSDECWPWTGVLTDEGYGRFWVSRSSRPMAHRVAYQALVGPVPDGMQLDHLCRNRACCNPEHLEPVSSAENTRRGESPAALNRRKTHCHRGHPLTPDNVYERTDRPGRMCRQCRRDAQARFRASRS